MQLKIVLQQSKAQQCLSTVIWALQAILADSADDKGLDVELAASGFGQQHQEVMPVPPLPPHHLSWNFTPPPPPHPSLMHHTPARHQEVLPACRECTTQSLPDCFGAAARLCAEPTPAPSVGKQVKSRPDGRTYKTRVEPASFIVEAVIVCAQTASLLTSGSHAYICMST